MDIDAVNRRVDEALAGNRRSEYIVIAMALAIFTLGIAIIIVAYWEKNPYIASIGTLSQVLLLMPIKAVIRIRMANIILQTLPTIIQLLPNDKSALEIQRCMEHLRKL